ncbi:MAG: T9SS type A sorting domain-containing protein, partial [Cyclobacteriaceae bacterium]
LDNRSISDVDVIQTSASAIPNGTYFIKKASGNAYLTATGTVGPCVNTANTSSNASQWVITHLGNEEYEIYNVAYPSSRLEVPYGETGNRAIVATSNWSGTADNLVWIAVAIGNSFQFKPKHDQQSALDIWQSNANVVHLWSANTNNANQRFQLIDAGGTATRKDIAEEENENSLTTQLSFKVYPNPATEKITVAGGFTNNKSIVITDLSGRQIYSVKVHETSPQLEVDISSYRPGVYLVRYGKEKLRLVKSR